MAAIHKVIEGAEAFYIEGNETGILLSHGFIGTPQSVRYVGNKLAEMGYTVLAPRLEGHGTHYKDLERCSYHDWFDSLEKAYERLAARCESIFVMGQSMGGTLALKFASEKRDKLKGVILINPALTIPSWESIESGFAPRYINEGSPDIKAQNVIEIAYPKVPVASIRELQRLMEETRGLLDRVTYPVMGFKSSTDHVVPPENTDFIMRQIRSAFKYVHVLPNSYHVATMDHDKDTICERSHSFIEQLAGNRVSI